jgi:hypothetical protein
VDVDAVLAGLYELLAPHLTEKQRRLLAGAAARALGRGGGARMARLTGLSRPTVNAGVRQLDDPLIRVAVCAVRAVAKAAGRAPAGPAWGIG